ncbi:hypothetical protein HYR69_00830 [Candidatus Sumerlaeota bacterium]|nr:hypothetical protein [Candidatus Sumerlaeota bacterium]
MKTFRMWFGLVGVGVAVIIGGLTVKSRAEVKPAEKETSDLMKKKLQHAQALLEGLAKEDYAKIRDNAKELTSISLDALYTKKHSPQYNQLSSEFRYATEKVVKMAEEKNLDGATLSYMQVVMSCVECHKLVRGQEETASADHPSFPRVEALAR